MIDLHTEPWVQVAELDKDNQFRFTKEWLEATKELGGHSRTFAAYLVSHWDLELGRMLDYFGPDELEEDLYSGIDGDPMDIREDIPDLWEYHGLPFDGLTGEWYRDIMRSKLITLRLPVRLVNDYIKAFKKSH